MHLSDIKQSPEHASVLSITSLYAPAIEMFFDLHAQLAELPKNPYKDDSPSLHGDMKELGLSFGTDGSMFILGGLEQIAISAFACAVGVAASAPLVQGAEFGFGMMSEAKNDNVRKDLKSVFTAPAKRSAFKREAALKPATNMMQASMKKAMQEKQYKAYLKALKRRQRLTSDLTTLKDKIHELNLMKTAGMNYAVLSADGERLDGILGTPRHILEAKRLQQKNTPQTPALNAPAYKMAV